MGAYSSYSLVALIHALLVRIRAQSAGVLNGEREMMRGDHLRRLNGQWVFRLRVPKDLRRCLGTEVTRDLGTANRNTVED